MVYLVRHGEPLFKDNGSYCIGRTDLPLSERGRRQASDLGIYFADKNIKAVYHSYLLRAKQTAELLSDGKYRVIEAKGLEEIDMGEWDGLTFSEIREKYPELYEMRGTDIIHVPVPGGENLIQGLSRFSRAVKCIIKEAEGNIVIVGHAGVNRIFLCEALGLDYNSVLSMAQPYGCINTLINENEDLYAESYGKMPQEAPCEAECRYLLKQFETPDEVVAHCMAVSCKAVKIAESLGSDYRFDLELIKSAALLHDIARVEKNHAKAGFKYLLKCGYPRVANIVHSHHNLAQEDLENITESTIVFYADKLIDRSEEVTLEERFSRSRRQCLTPEAQASHKLQYDQALRVRDLIERRGPYPAACSG
ncbi:MAG: histidine phosphatase family protein [Treponema sp.]|jgi:putative nucleotidyltransferase with HDIG domain|nr:histidine phosphatase family protein [Treponema sp.]